MKKKILFVLPSLEMGGAEKVMVSLFNNLDKASFYTTLVAFAPGILESKVKDKDKLIVLGYESVLSGILSFINVVNNLNPQIIFSTQSHLNALLCFLRKINIIKSKLIISPSRN